MSPVVWVLFVAIFSGPPVGGAAAPIDSSFNGFFSSRAECMSALNTIPGLVSGAELGRPALFYDLRRGHERAYECVPEAEARLLARSIRAAGR